MEKSRKHINLKRFIIVVCSALIALLVLFFVNEHLNENVRVTEYTFENARVPKGFDGFKIMVISDLHEADFATQIVSHIENEKPDIVAFTGDMCQLPDFEVTQAVKIAMAKETENVRFYAVTGNHETQSGHYDEIKWKLKDAGIIFLDDNHVWFEKGGDYMWLLGVKDPETDSVKEWHIEKMRNEIEENRHGDDFSVLLMHRADLYPDINDTGVDLILSGHLHGGIVRLPFVGGLIGRGEGKLLPEYEYGLYEKEGCASMIVSGGCDKNPEKKRIFNQPEVVMITLKAEDENE